VTSFILLTAFQIHCLLLTTCYKLITNNEKTKISWSKQYSTKQQSPSDML